MEKCYQFFRCRKKDCPAYENKDQTECWELEDTLCNSPHQEIMQNHKKSKCHYCHYYQLKHPSD